MMELRKLITSTAAGVALCGSMLSAPAFAESQQFSALEGINAQAMSQAEMDAVHGQITATQIQTAYVSLVNRLVARGRITQAQADTVMLRFNTAVMPRLITLFGL